MGLYARGTLREILARGRGSTDREQHGSYKNDRGQYSSVQLEQERLESILSYVTRAKLGCSHSKLPFP